MTAAATATTATVEAARNTAPIISQLFGGKP